jgi:hypothetical protein
LIKDTHIENRSAVQNPETEKSGTIRAANKIKVAFITRENRPSVSIVIGNVSTKIIGLMNIFITPNTTAKISAPDKVTDTPGSTYADIKIAPVEIIQCFIFIFYILSYFYFSFFFLSKNNVPKIIIATSTYGKKSDSCPV